MKKIQEVGQNGLLGTGRYKECYRERVWVRAVGRYGMAFSGYAVYRTYLDFRFFR